MGCGFHSALCSFHPQDMLFDVLHMVTHIQNICICDTYSGRDVVFIILHIVSISLCDIPVLKMFRKGSGRWLDRQS